MLGPSVSSLSKGGACRPGRQSFVSLSVRSAQARGIENHAVRIFLENGKGRGPHDQQLAAEQVYAQADREGPAV